MPFTPTPKEGAEQRLLLPLESFAIVRAVGRHGHHDGVFSRRFAAPRGTGAIVQRRQLVGGSGGKPLTAEPEILFAELTVRARQRWHVHLRRLNARCEAAARVRLIVR